MKLSNAFAAIAVSLLAACGGGGGAGVAADDAVTVSVQSNVPTFADALWRGGWDVVDGGQASVVVLYHRGIVASQYAATVAKQCAGAKELCVVVTDSQDSAEALEAKRLAAARVAHGDLCDVGAAGAQDAASVAGGQCIKAYYYVQLHRQL